MSTSNVPAWLVPPRFRRLSPSRSTSGSSVQPIECVILHYTVSQRAQAAINWMTGDNKVSAHFVVDRDGTIYQLVPLTDRAWHAGGRSSSWRGKPVNSRSIGIEIANSGPLFDRGDGRPRNWWDRAPIDRPLRAAYRLERGGPLHKQLTQKGVTVTERDLQRGSFDMLWAPYPAAQIASVEWLVQMLAQVFPILRQRDEQAGELPRICGHEDVDPTRKTDPGPAFPMQQVRDRVR